ncbi:UNVERIFIED_CONTAM: hypothetical protein RMT77_007415 [Armadillidium vulgare]
MSLLIYQTLLITITSLTFDQTESYVPLGMDGFKVKIYLPEFNGYGMRLRSQTGTDFPVSISDDDQAIFRRHASVQTKQEGRKNPEETEVDPGKEQIDSLKKFFNRNIVHEIYPNKRRYRFDTRGNVTFLSKQGGMKNLRKFLQNYYPEGHSEQTASSVEEIPTDSTEEIEPPVTFDPTYFENLEFLRSTKDAFENSFSQPILGSNNFKENNERRVKRLHKPFEILVPEQYKRVIETAKTLQIPTGLELGNSEEGKALLIISPKGLPDEGSLAHIKINPVEDDGKLKTSFNFNIMKGPYDDIYHRQYHNDLKGVSSILGKSAKFATIPNKNTVLSKIILSDDWDIYRIR